MKKWFFIAFGVVTLGILVLLGIGVSRLPAPSEVVKLVSPSRSNSPSAPAPVSDKVTSVEPVPSTEGGTARSERRTKTNSTSPSETQGSESLSGKVFDFIEESPADIRVCENLGRTRILKKKELPFRDFMEGGRDDSLIEAMRFPFRAIFQTPEVVEVLRDFREAEQKANAAGSVEPEGFLDKAVFYGKLARAGAALYVNRGKYEALTDRAIHLRVLAEMAVRQPDLANSAAIMDFCREMEGFEGTPSRETLQNERTQLKNLIQSSGFRFEDLDFEPQTWTRFQLKAKKDRIYFSMKTKEKDMQ